MKYVQTLNVGVAGFVINDKNQVLAIKERYSGKNARWKLPGGGADLGKRLYIHILQ